jgi:NDP-sugar pyrophosphorylase family protein
MKAMILSAGVGSRLFPLTDKLPKPMLPLANKPTLEYLVDLCKANNIKDIRMNLYYRPEVIDTYFQDGKKWGVNISYSLEKKLLGTAGAVKRSEMFFDDTFVVLSGDGYTDLDLSEMLDFHKKNRAKVTIAVKKVDDTSKYGVVVRDNTGRITEFQEKPTLQEAKSDFANLGIYIIEPEIISLIPKNEPYDFGYQLFPKLLTMQIPFYSYETDAFWTDIGDINEYWNLNMSLITNKTNGSLDKDYKLVGEQVSIGKNSKISELTIKTINGPVIIGNNSIIGDDVIINAPVVIGDNVIIEKGATISKSIVLSNTYIGKKINLDKSITIENYTMNINHNYGLMVDDEKIFGTVLNETFSQKLSETLINLFDRAIATVALTALAPLFALIAILIKIDSKGPIFYKSRRILSPTIKMNGKNWNLFKGEKGLRYVVFRTMYIESDKNVKKLKNKYENGPFVKIENDPRITRIGKLLRKTSIDELPLLFNVLKGEMSLVGIWALPTYEAESLLVNGLKTYAGKEELDFSEMAQVRFNGKIGLAGYWQSRGRSQLSAEERALHDSFQAAQYRFGNKYKNVLGKYSEHLSFTGYLKMISETFLSVVKRTGAI